MQESQIPFRRHRYRSTVFQVDVIVLSVTSTEVVAGRFGSMADEVIPRLHEPLAVLLHESSLAVSS